MSLKIVLLCSECFSTTVLYNYISKYYPVSAIITEEPMRGLALAKRRIKKLGIFRVAGQVAFSAVIVPVLNMFSKTRIDEIRKSYSFNETRLPAEKITHFSSVNDESCISHMEKLNPDIVLVNGTRIISAKMLKATSAIFINMHAGITPWYRGVHGAYWAAVNNDYKNCGVTIHLVDKGIDTGGILFQEMIKVTKKDNFVTYPFLQYGEGLPLIRKAIDAAAQNSLRPKAGVKEKGKLWYHPTIWQYLFFRIVKGKK